MRTVDKKYTFWLAGYYDDFTNAKAIPDDSNTMGSTWKSIETHHGNPLSELAPYNPRYAYAWCVRGTGVGGATFPNTNAPPSPFTRTKHNNGMNEWLTFDPDFLNQTTYFATTHMQYPDSKTNSNRQKFDGGTAIHTGGVAYLGTDPVEGYLMFSNSYNTQGKYYAFNGRTDASYGRDEFVFKVNALGTGLTGDTLKAGAGVPLSQLPNELTYRIDTHLAGVYTGERIIDDAITGGNNNSGAQYFHYPIKSPSGNNFLVQEVYAEATHASGGFFPTLVYQNSLNCKGDKDTFVLRAAILANNAALSGGAKFKILFGYADPTIPITSAATADTAGTVSKYAVDITLTTGLYQGSTDMNWNTGIIDAASDLAWKDYEVELDFTNQQYQLYIDGVASGSATAFNAHPDGRDWLPVDFYGWELQADNCEEKATILIDRVGVIRYLNDSPTGTLDTTPVVESFDYSSTVNSTSTLNIEVVDDDDIMKMLAFFNQASFSDWSLLAYRDNIDRPFWRGHITGMSQSFDANSRTPKISITAEDYLNNIDHQVPVWELGEGGDGNSTQVVAYNRQESQGRLSSYYFGASELQVGNAGLGFNEIEDGTNTWEAHVDSRMRLRSAHPIQLYNDEDTSGANDAHDRWDDAITNGYAATDAQYRSLHSRWIQDLPKSQWFTHMFGRIKKDPKVSVKTTATFTQGSTTSLTLDGGGYTLFNGGHIEFVDADGTIDSGVVSSASYATTHSDILVAWLYYAEMEFSTTLNAYYNPVLNPMGQSSFGQANTNYYRTQAIKPAVHAVALAPVGLNLDKKTRRIINSEWEVFNQEWGFKATNDTVRQRNAGGTYQTYEIYLLAKPIEVVINAGTVHEFTASWKTSSNFDFTYDGDPIAGSRYEEMKWYELSIEDGLDNDFIDIVYNNSNNTPAGVPPMSGFRMRDTNAFRTGAGYWTQNPTSLWRKPTTSGGVYELDQTYRSVGKSKTLPLGQAIPVQAVGGATTINLPTTNFFQKDHASGTTVNVLDISNDFKHIYVQWADMRNDGFATADGLLRKRNFGLLKPTSQNYELSLVYAEQNTDGDEEREQFVDLVIGDDVEIWEMDAMTDPLTGETWGCVSGGSDSESNSKYHNWEEKAGAFLIIDTSKFFNLNTYSNGGISGQIAGGRKEIGDYIVETEGFPILLDNYWKRATTTPHNVDDNRAWTYNYKLLENLGSGLKEGIRIGDRAMQLVAPTIIDINSNNDFNNENPTTVKLVSDEKNIQWFANVYERLGVSNGMTLAPDGAGFAKVQISGSGSPTDIHHLREGHYITVTGCSIASLDGTYQLLPHPLCQVGSGTWEGRIALADSAFTLPSNQTFNINLNDTYVFYRMMAFNSPIRGSKSPGVWDGTNYSGIGLTSAWLAASSKTIAMNSTSNTLTLSSGNWIDYGFRKGMNIRIEDLNNTANNGVKRVLDITGSIMTVDNISTTVVASASPSVYEEYYNTNSGEWLINNSALQGANVNPIISAPSLITGATPNQEGSRVDIPLTGENGYEDVVVYANASSIFPMKLMMQLNGFIKNRASMTFMEHDKFRFTYLDSLTHTWLNQANLYGIPDLGTIPRTQRMNISQKDALTTGRAGAITSIAISGGGGGIFTQTITSANHGLVANDIIEIISNDKLSSSSTDENNRKQFTVVSSTTNEFVVNDTNSLVESTGTGMWRKVSALDSYGHVSDCRNTSILNVFSNTQQGSGIGEDVGTRTVFSYLMGRDSKPSFRATYSNGFVFNHLNLRISNLTTENSQQVSNVRVFYAGDGSFVDHPQATLGAKPRWEILDLPQIMSKDEALTVAKQEFEKQKEAPLNISCEITNLDDNMALQDNDGIMVKNARYGYVADQSRTISGYYNSATVGNQTDHFMYWTSLRGGNLFTGIQNALDYAGRTSTNFNFPTPTVPATSAYYWYGLNSVSYAMQVVHIPNGMPKRSEATKTNNNYFLDGHLRIAIDIADITRTQELDASNGYDSGNFVFRVILLDYEFNKSSSIGGANLKSMSSVNVDSNGLYEIPIPSTYWANQTGNERIIISVNYDYLASLVIRRCMSGDKTLNANDFAGVSYGYTHNQESPFPLGVHGGVGFGNAGYWNLRKEWYAPRLHVVDDLNFQVGTTLQYTDTRLQLDSQPMSIKQIGWSVSGNDSERVSLNLERDVSRLAKNFAFYLKPKVGINGKQKFGDPFGRSGFPTTASQVGGDSFGKPRQGVEERKHGDQASGTTRSANLQPNIAPPRRNSPDGTTSASNSPMVMGSTNLSRNLNNRIKGKLDLNNSSVLGDSFSILGQKKPQAPPRNAHSQQSIDSFIIPEGGDAVMSSSGFAMAGGVGEVGAPQAYASTKVHLRIPADAQSNHIKIMANANLISKIDGHKAVVFLTIKCLETDYTITSEVHIPSTAADEITNIVLFDGNLSGAEVSGNTVEILFERQAGVNNDSASTSSLAISNLQIINDTRSVSGKAKSSDFTNTL